jgi:hypothetical protein
MTAALVVWDFDGVLNAEPPEGPFGWVAHLDRTLGVSPAAFRAFLNQPGQAAKVLRGRVSLEQELADWLATQSTDVSAETLLAHWLLAEDRPEQPPTGRDRHQQSRPESGLHHAGHGVYRTRGTHFCIRANGGRETGSRFFRSDRAVVRIGPSGPFADR